MRGFPTGTTFTPVPDPLLGPILEQIDDLAELKCTLRVLWLLKRKPEDMRLVFEAEVLADPALTRGLAGQGDSRGAILSGLEKAVERGTLLRVEVDTERGPHIAYLLNDAAGKESAAALKGRQLSLGDSSIEQSGPPAERPNIFTLYEDNIGLITPLIADRLKEAEQSYPWDWIQEAFDLAVARNVRKWRYIESILERWATEGRGEHGKSGRYPEKISLKEYRRRYGRPAGE